MTADSLTFSDLPSSPLLRAAEEQAPARPAAIAVAERPATPPEAILAERWPVLSKAMGRYEQNVAEEFTREAYDRIHAGILRLDDRRDLAARAKVLGIREFDSQLLIACAVRQWSLDRRYDATPRRSAPALSYEYKNWSRRWLRVAIVVGAALSIDLVIIMKWLS